MNVESYIVDNYITNPNLNMKPPRPPLARSIQDLVKLAKLPKIEPAIKIRLYFQSILNLYDQGSACWADGDLERAYIYFIKISILFLEKLPRYHPRFNDIFEIRSGIKDINLLEIKSKIKKKCENVLQNLEIIKPKLIEYYKSLPREPDPVLKIEELQSKVVQKTGLPIEKVSELTPKTFLELKEMVRIWKINIPRLIFENFLKLFEKNTKKGIESCGLLSGKNLNGEIIVTHLIIPKQIGTYTTCVSLNEEDILTYHTTNNLIMIGWIHTHPDFDCFLSSIDLHMQLGYQLILPEAIAVVLAPKREKSIGIFTLTKKGIEVLKNCTHGTTFHKHTELELYNEAKHVNLINSRDYTVVKL